MGTNFTRHALTVGLIGASLAAATPAGAVVADKNLAVRHENAVAVSTQTQTAPPRVTPPNVQRALRDDANPTRFSSPAGESISSGSGFSWGDAAIGAAGTLALLAMGGSVLLIGRRRQRLPITG